MNVRWDVQCVFAYFKITIEGIFIWQGLECFEMLHNVNWQIVNNALKDFQGQAVKVLDTEDDNMVLKKIGNSLSVYMASHPRIFESSELGGAHG